MPDLPKEELDKVFREGADQYDFPFKPEAWEHMESLLDRDRRRSRLLWWWLGVLGLLLLSFGLGGYFFWGATPEGSMPEQVLKHSPENPVIEEALPKSEGRQDSLNAQQIPGDGSEKKQVVKNEISQREKAGDPKSQTDQETVLPGAPDARTTPNTNDPVTVTHVPTEKPDQPENVPPSAAEPATNGTDPSATQPEPAEYTDFGILAPLPSELILILNVPDYLAADLPDSMAQVNIPEIEPASRSKLVLGLSLSTEVVSVGWDDFSRLGIKGGVVAEYLYFRRLGLRVGANLMRKSYLAGKGEYHPPYGFWTRKIAPIKTDGSCSILEIPVMMTYYTRGYDRPGVFGAFGASSYVMLSEKYEYIYDVPDADLIRDWSSGENLTHWMSMLNFSIGYNGFLSNRFGYRLGLYGQTPLVGVGHGEVKLHSLGLNFILSFQKSAHQ